MHPLIAAYFELVNTIVPGPQSLSYFVSPALLVIGLLIPPHVLSHNALACLFMPVVLVATIDGWRCMGGVDVVSVDTLWWCLLFLVFKDPKKDFRRVLEDGSEEAYPERGLWRRLQWVGILLSERPLTCWKIGEKRHDRKVLRPYIQQSREKSVWSIVRVLVPTLLMLMPLALQSKANDPFFQTAGQPLSMPFAASSGTPQAIYYLQSLIPPEILRPATQGLYTYCLMIVLFLPPFLLPVVLTYLFASPNAHWSPHTWPRPHFGPISAVFDSGLRGLWGTWWHQQMRHAVSEPGRWLAKKLSLTKGGFARYASICVSAFLLSGVTHMGIVPPQPRYAGVFDAWNLRLKVAGFFWVQPFGILLEVKMVDPALRCIRWRTLRRTLRVAWVLAFMGFAFILLLDPFMEMGCWRLWPPPITSPPIYGLLKGDWVV